ncbi:PhnD/SsuA/transferrin family substrate-binding protein [Sulfitobacter sp. G21635-S1]|uniref:phosphate/phosphite/phosphonate ABC transporter substrate-binding protein n=1 Tax=Sulfitobacter sp. G21635-S1 TaxID=3014043 RepID=UPI0022AF1BC8|nr:PhnD/SsuA/transferrin family substrate-binding protein [Sulfitobacter sp. G21635-S1]MCZ4255931.1 PhnD/SsuA/transferrin family substrate-binding protein [Sulfitobacter sp. G21635-S1]
MIASLMMYARPETDAALERYWAHIRAALAGRGIDAPVALSNSADAFAVWTDPELVLSQTCGMPYRTQLHDKVTLVGTPDFGVTGCPPGYYRSAIVVRAGDDRAALADFASARFIYNQTLSQSGFAAIHAAARAAGFWFQDRSQSHGHVNSARAVAEGRADIAALDAVTWRLIRQFEPCATQLRVLAWTEPTPGLPYITARGRDGSAIFDAVAEAMAALSEPDRAALGLKGMVAIPSRDYLAVPNPPPADV